MLYMANTEDRKFDELEIVIIDGNGKTYKVKTEKKRLITAKGPLGESTISITKKGAQFISSPCPNHTCIKTGLIKKVNETAACVPNKIIITIKPGNDNSLHKQSPLDGLTQ